MANKVIQFEGDIRLWIKNPTTGALTPVNPDPDDPQGNTPVEATTSIFSYEAGEERTVVSKRRARYKQTIYSEQDPGVSSVQFQLVAVPALLMARMFYGEATTNTVTGAAVSNEAVVIAQLGVPYKLSKRSLSASPAPVVTDVAGTTTYAVDDDYVIDARNGTILAVSGGAITAAQTVQVDFTHASYTETVIRGGVKPVETFYATGDMKNRVDGKDTQLTIWEAKLSNDGDVDLFADEPISPTLSGTLVTPEGKTEPYEARIVE